MGALVAIILVSALIAVICLGGDDDGIWPTGGAA